MGDRDSRSLGVCAREGAISLQHARDQLGLNSASEGGNNLVFSGVPPRDTGTGLVYRSENGIVDGRLVAVP